MRRIYEASGSYLVAGRERSWGSFRRWGDAASFIREVEADDRRYAARRREESARIRARIAEDERLFEECRRAQRKADALLYEGGFSSDSQTYQDAKAAADALWDRRRASVIG